MNKRDLMKYISIGICASLFIVLPIGFNSLFAADSYEIHFGCGGGFTATHHTYRVIQDGTVYYGVQSFTSPDFNEEETIIGRISRKDVKQFYSRLLAIGFKNIDYVNPHNMSCSLGLTDIDTTHSVTWPMGFNESSAPDVIKPVVDIFKDIDRLVSPLRVRYKPEKL